MITREGFKLTAEAEAEYMEFIGTLSNAGCRCYISPPCNHCLHPGNPDNLAESDDAWEPDYAQPEAPQKTPIDEFFDALKVNQDKRTEQSVENLIYTLASMDRAQRRAMHSWPRDGQTEQQRDEKLESARAKRARKAEKRAKSRG